MVPTHQFARHGILESVMAREESRRGLIMAVDHHAGLRSWLDVSAARTASDIALGGIALAIGTAAIVSIDGTPFSRLDLLNEWFFPAVVSGMLLAVGAILVARGSFFSYGQPLRWSPNALIIIVATAGTILLAMERVTPGIPNVVLLFGPAEYVTLILLILTIAVAFARMSRIRAIGMVLLGLLLATVGMDSTANVARLTMGVEAFEDGLWPMVVWLGLTVIADGTVCMLSPTVFAAIYARQVAGWSSPRIPIIASLSMRIAAALVIVAAFFYAFTLDATAWEYGELLVFGLFGIACKVFGWNRLVLILAFGSSPLLEANIRRAMQIAGGDPTVFLRGPINVILVLISCGVMAGVALMWMRRSLFRKRGAC
jgi:TctA family transporter